MEINGATLPRTLCEAIADSRLYRRVGSWPLITNKDYFGNQLEAELGHVFRSLDEIKKETQNLPRGFEIENSEVDAYVPGVGGIPIIRDFSQIVCFAMSGDGAPFCLDYRASAVQPSVIWWDDIYWRMVAPDFDAFLSLFDFNR
jgi:SMI1 / KNR4 family (SUKH-1)